MILESEWAFDVYGSLYYNSLGWGDELFIEKAEKIAGNNVIARRLRLRLSERVPQHQTHKQRSLLRRHLLSIHAHPHHARGTRLLLRQFYTDRHLPRTEKTLLQSP